MKLYVKDSEVYFDYSEISMSTRVDSPDYLKAVQASRFMRETNCGWDYTETEQVIKMSFTPYEWATEYGNTRQFESLLKDCFYKAKTCSLIEITLEVEKLLVRTAKRCRDLYEAEVEKEQALKRKAEWERKCENGCGSCEHKMRIGDDYFCGAIDELLHEKNISANYGKMHYPFIIEAFPTDSCPYNVNKIKEAI